MLNDPTVKKSLVVSVIASVIVIIFVEPVLNSLTELFLWLIPYVSESFSDGLYADAAIGFREKYSFLLFSIIVTLFTSLALG